MLKTNFDLFIRVEMLWSSSHNNSTLFQVFEVFFFFNVTLQNCIYTKICTYTKFYFNEGLPKYKYQHTDSRSFNSSIATLGFVCHV